MSKKVKATNKKASISYTLEFTYVLNLSKYPDFIPNKSNNPIATSRHYINFSKDTNIYQESKAAIIYIRYLLFFYLGEKGKDGDLLVVSCY